MLQHKECIKDTVLCSKVRPELFMLMEHSLAEYRIDDSENVTK